MKIGQYRNIFDPSLSGRIGIFLNDEKILDPQLLWSLIFQKKGHYHFKEMASRKMPTSLAQLLKFFDSPLERLQEVLEEYKILSTKGDLSLLDGTPIMYSLKDEYITSLKPIDEISTYRDFYAHEKHVKTGFAKRNEKIPEAWYEFPVYYKGPTSGFIGPYDEILWPSYSNKLDYELELAIIIGKSGKNIEEEKANEHIFGLTILNDISARDIQKKEMSVRLGPSKGKDFCSVIGPLIQTLDDFSYQIPNLLMTAKVNGEEWSRGYSGDAHFTFNQMIAHASQDEWILPGDLMGSGTVGTGCGLELDKWIQPGDLVELEIENIGKLINKVGSKESL